LTKQGSVILNVLMTKTGIFSFLLILGNLVFAQDMAIGLYYNRNIKKIDFAYHDGSYRVYADKDTFRNILPNEFVSLRYTSDKMIELREGTTLKGKYKEVRLVPNNPDFHLRLDVKEPSLKMRRYQGGFRIKGGDKGLVIVNNVSMENYLAGVVESEGGGGKHIEYYKAQAVISRTYALRHKQRHKSDGFDLCDEVHCQAYLNALRYTPDIREAVNETKGVYMVDSVSKEKVQGFFHANCGGETSSSDYIWKENIPYLQPFKDTFCIHTAQANWEQRIPKTEWTKYFVNNYFYPLEDSIYRSMLYSFEQDTRKIFYLNPHLGIPLKDIRVHFKLKSTFFSVYDHGDYVLLKGKGFGHGVGMCQEGAMNMAKKGFDYQKILMHYFDRIAFENKVEEKFFNQTVEEAWDF
jgi:stage II sporulation protein D